MKLKVFQVWWYGFLGGDFFVGFCFVFLSVVEFTIRNRGHFSL